MTTHAPENTGLPTIHSNVDAYERARAAAHAPRDSATKTSKAIAFGVLAAVSVLLIIAGAIIDGPIGALIGFTLAAGITGIGGTAVWMAEHSHRKEIKAREAAARRRAQRRNQQPNQPTA